MNLIQALRGKEKLTGQHMFILGALIVGFILLSTWSVGYTSRSEFCNACHEMNPMYQTWQTSSHKEVACFDCHAEPGIQGLVKAKAKGIKEVYLHMVGATANIKADERNINCFSCHQDKAKTNLEKASAAKDPHTQKHFDNGMTCVSCHAGIVHNGKMNNMTPSRETCSSCHLDQMKK
jgi:trimethylamine-N-oxide reductase cytochrome c-type subunit TorC